MILFKSGGMRWELETEECKVERDVHVELTVWRACTCGLKKVNDYMDHILRPFSLFLDFARSFPMT